MTAQAQLLALEASRLEALERNDVEAVLRLMWGDLVHVHATGKIDNIDAYNEGLRQLPRKTQRMTLQVKQLTDDVAILYGDVVNSVIRLGTTQPDIVPMTVTQVAVRRGGEWRFSLFHASRKS